MCPVGADQCQPINPRHDEVLQNDGRRDLLCKLDCTSRIRAEMEVDIGCIGQCPAHGLGNDQLIIHEQHHGAVFACLERLSCNSGALDIHCGTSIMTISDSF